MNIRNYLFVFLVAICLDVNGQDIELIHHVSSDHLFSIQTEDNRDLSIYILIFLKVQEVGIINHRHIFLFQDGMNLVIMKEEIFLVYIVLLLV